MVAGRGKYYGKASKSTDGGLTFTELGTWYTCNYNQSVPESIGDNYTFYAANALGVTLPSRTQFNTLIGGCTWTWLTVHGHPGYVAKCLSGFLFLPAQRSTDGRYWSSTDCDDDIYDYAFHLEIGSEGEHSVYRFFRNEEYAVRPIQK